jgi:hypothetical protein
MKEIAMAIEVEAEDVEALKAWGIGLEKVAELCVLCRKPSRTWHRASNQPVCQACASTRSPSDLIADKHCISQ